MANLDGTAGIPLVVLPQVTLNGRVTTALGFGGSLLGSASESEARRLLAAAYDAGIRHFDVAPMYGHGAAERLLREALGAHLGDVTVTTKYGLEPPPQSMAKRVARRLLAPFPALKRRLERAPLAGMDEPVEDPSLPPLTAAAAQRSIDQSLRNLGVDSLDLLLLHEATPGRLADPRLLEVLESNQRAGKIGEFGVGSRSARVELCVQERPLFCPFLQYEWSVFSRPRPLLERYPRIVHGSLGGGHVPDPQQLKDWSRTLGLDLGEPGLLARLQLKASLVHHAGHLVLFSTRNLRNLEANVRTAEDHSLDAPARELEVLAGKS